MKKKTYEHWPTLIVMDGRPYQLVELETNFVNDPCTMCDLRLICDAHDEQLNLIDLCKSDARDDRWYFAEDWTIFDKPLCDFLNPELTDYF